MKVQNYRKVAGMEAAPGVLMRIVAGPEESVPTFVMRVFEIQPGCATPHHSHPWEHEMFVLLGEGTLKSGDIEKPLREGDAITVLADEMHGIANTSGGLLRVICVVPLVDGRMPGMAPSD